MTVIQTSAEHNTSDEIRCPHCGSPLPAYAAFCGACGQRVDSAGQGEQVPHTPAISANNEERYRITALVGRRSHVQLFFATDTLFKRPVTIRDITVSSLNEELQEQALKATRSEYDLLRRQRIPGLTPVIDFRASNGHILVVSGWPFPLPEGEGNIATRTHTLEDLLQSGLGLPNELVALTWIHSLCTVVSQLHRSSIIVGTLDPASVVISTASYTGQPALMVSWLPQAVRTLLLQTSSFIDTSHFSAPEAQQGQLTPRSDLYSLGALLYLLLTGVAPEEQTSWIRTPIQKLRERTPRVSKGTEELVLCAISPDPSERFQNVDEMSEALQQQITSIASRKRGRSTKGYHSTTGERGAVQGNVEQSLGEAGEAGETIEATVSVVPIRAQLARWHISLQETKDMTHDIQQIAAQSQARLSTPTQPTQTPEDTLEIQETARTNTGENERIEITQEETPTQTKKDKIEAEAMVSSAITRPLPETGTPESASEVSEAEQPSPIDAIQDTPSRPVEEIRPPSLRARITGLIPAFPKKTPSRVPATQADLDASTKPTFLSRLQQLFIGEQRQRTTAAALIETPLRVQPNQGYTIRIHLMGRDTPTTPRGAKKGTQPVGLSSLKKDEVVHIEVRSAIYQNYAYIVQRADVHIPGEGFAAEVTIPMQPLSGGQNGRRERMHIFFMDELRQPLYEKPFVLEVFVSHLVQTGREGHSVLTIPV